MLQTNRSTIKKYISEILTKRISENASIWLDKSMENIRTSEKDKELFTSFSVAPRFVGKDRLKLNKEELDQATQIKNGFNPESLRTDQLTRILLLLTAYKNDFDSFKNKTRKILSAADIEEQVAIYSGLSLYPHGERFTDLAADGLRTNMTAVFDAIVLENPYPSEYLSESAWNQMVLKSVFTNRALYKIWDFDRRRNKSLSIMLSDFAHERWAAGRTTTPELWRAVGPFINNSLLSDIEKILKSDNPLEVEAGCLACWESTLEESKKRLLQHPHIHDQITSGALSWDSLGHKLQNNLNT